MSTTSDRSFCGQSFLIRRCNVINSSFLHSFSYKVFDSMNKSKKFVFQIECHDSISSVFLFGSHKNGINEEVMNGL